MAWIKYLDQRPPKEAEVWVRDWWPNGAEYISQVSAHEICGYSEACEWCDDESGPYAMLIML